MANAAQTAGWLEEEHAEAVVEASALSFAQSPLLPAVERRLAADLYELEAPVPKPFTTGDDDDGWIDNDPTRFRRRIRPLRRRRRRRDRNVVEASQDALPTSSRPQLPEVPVPFRVISWQSAQQSNIVSTAITKPKRAATTPLTPVLSPLTELPPVEGALHALRHHRLERPLKAAEAAYAKACDFDHRGDYNFAYDYYELAQRNLLLCLELDVTAGVRQEMQTQLDRVLEVLAELSSARIPGEDVRRLGRPVFDYSLVMRARKEAGSVKFRGVGGSSSTHHASPLSPSTQATHLFNVPSPPTNPAMGTPWSPVERARTASLPDGRERRATPLASRQSTTLPDRQGTPVPGNSRSTSPATNSRASTPSEELRKLSPEHPRRGLSAYVPAEVDDPRALKSRAEHDPNFVPRPCYQSSDIWHRDVNTSSKSVTRQIVAHHLRDAGNPSWQKDTFWDATGTYHGADAISKNTEIELLRQSNPRCAISLPAGIDSGNDDEDDDEQEEEEEDDDDFDVEAAVLHPEQDRASGAINDSLAGKHSCATCGRNRGPQGSFCFPCNTCKMYWYCSEPCLRMKTRCHSGSCALLSARPNKRKSPEVSRAEDVDKGIAAYIDVLGKDDRKNKLPRLTTQPVGSLFSWRPASHDGQLARDEEAARRNSEQTRRLHGEGLLMAAIAGRPARASNGKYANNESPQSKADEERQLQTALLNSMSSPTHAASTSRAADPPTAPEGRRVDAIRYSKDYHRTIEYLCTLGRPERTRWIDGFDISRDRQPWAATIETF
ncbi:Putative Zinc finger, MYND-type, MIT domain superfamily [Septoria linicola]|uniref:Zinc finger, MYND-type, MIT domain superfamily n=1 Tax=Septoria linicola TaxID=215465 RepID=A0A9Q9EDS9_9PEZI|nr:putative Zinc finger, MYND-type, MIT domain superfamily [Septoria linicola]USW47130.1 Putative Zinc finger, MYND-type, MIT domain superfamily [Septoria linicola]